MGEACVGGGATCGGGGGEKWPGIHCSGNTQIWVLIIFYKQV